MKKAFLLFGILLMLHKLCAQELYEGFNPNTRGSEAIRIAFYNVENLFDTEDDSLKNDEEFLPEGMKHWDKRKYWKKQNQIAKTISAIGGWEAPAIVGLAEVENKHALINLVQHTQLKAHNYKFIHFESPDRRGIDVALLYRYEKVEILHKEAIPVKFSEELGGHPTRDILYVKLSVLEEDTIHLFVNHWPSRWGGQMQTEPKRMFVASLLKEKADSVLATDSQAAIVMMGDLNDAPTDKSLLKSLEARLDTAEQGNYFNLSLHSNAKGTHYYQGHWSALDQMVVSKPLLNGKGTHLQHYGMNVFKASFLLEENKLGIMVPNRTFHGMKYHGGYSDHLPIFIDVYLKTP